MLEIDGLTVKYHEAIGLEDFSLDLQQGEVAAVIGPNGAGKTSLLRAIAGFLGREAGTIAGGTIKFRGVDLRGKAPYSIASLGIALVPERDKVFPSLTVAEQLSLAIRVVGRRRYEQELERVLGLFTNLKKHLKRPAGYLSGGERQMLSIGAALCTAPKLLLIDELSQGLAPGLTEALVEQVGKIKDEGMTLLIVEQNVSVAAALASKIYVVDAGRLVASEQSSAIFQREDLMRTYLGLAGKVVTSND